MIEEYRPGIITINGQSFENDIETDWFGEISDWSRKESGVIGAGDLEQAVAKGPETIVIGTGQEGDVKITEEAESLIAKNGIKLIADRTEEAVKTFNILKEDSLEEEGSQAKVVGLFCLT